MRYLITFSYDGSYYSGYQKQNNLLTVQGEIENILTSINNGVKVIIHASGRTDKGVHALNQKAHFDLDLDIKISKLKQAINSYTRKSLYIKKIEVVNNDFHARYMVKNKQYLYIINMGEYNPLEVNYVYQYNKLLNIIEIEKGCNYLLGKHNFKSFTSNEDKRDNYIREIFDIKIKEENNKLFISIVGTGFLKYQIRNMIGTLIKIGEEKRLSTEIVDILKQEDRCAADQTAPACGLYLEEVNY